VSSETHIATLMKADNPQLDKYTESAIQSLGKYTSHPSMDEELVKKTNAAIEDATRWSEVLRAKFSDLNMHEVHSTDRITIEITKFEEAGEQHIYEFLHDFNTCYRARGSDTIKATQLWKSHLSRSIQMETESLKTDLKGLVEYLRDNYGDADTVVDVILRPVEKLKTQPFKHNRDKHLYMKKYLNALQKLEAIPTSTDITPAAWELAVLAHRPFQRITKIMPYDDQKDYSKELNALGFTQRKVQGRIPFQALVKFVEAATTTTARIEDLDDPLPPPADKVRDDRYRRAAHAVHEVREVDLDPPRDRPQPAVHTLNTAIDEPCSIQRTGNHAP
jgi:hypothetical protein